MLKLCIFGMNIANNRTMSFYPYQSFDEPRTASRQSMGVHSVQSWKSKHNVAQKQELTIKENSFQTRTACFKHDFNSFQKSKPSEAIALDGTTIKQNNFGFFDVIDIVNPLQHIPLVNMAYRRLTGDQMHPMAGIVGGTLYGGPIGAITGTINAISKIQTGKDIADTTLGFMGSSFSIKA